MRAAISLLLVAIFFASVCYGVYPGYTPGHNGRPACLTDAEMLRPWKNNFDPTKYFVCKTKGEPGVELRCPQSSGFLDSAPIFGCVNWAYWVPCPPYDPPSLAPNNGCNDCTGCGGCS